MARKFKRDRFISASEIAQVSHCPYLYYQSINHKNKTQSEEYAKQRGDYMHAQMAKGARSHSPVDASGFKYKEKISLFGRLWRWLVGLFSGR